MEHSAEQWQVIGWDGITLEVPLRWQPTVILRDYLFFEQEGKPVCEIKWQHGGRSIAPERVLKKIGGILKQSQAVLREWKIPPALAEQLGGFSVTGFQCRDGAYDSRGLLLSCPVCRRTTLLRFYDRQMEKNPTVHRLLASFADHPDNRDRLWAVYDISARLPVGAKLQFHEFLAGRFTLVFSLDGTAVTLWRFKPAAALLGNQDLPAFGARLAGAARPAGSTGPDAITWMETASGPQRLIRRLRRLPVWTWLKLWHIPAENVILGVRGEGKRFPLEAAVMEKIGSTYTARNAM